MADTDLILNVIEKTTGNGLRDGARDLDNLADSADHTNGSMRALARDSGHVDSEIVRLRGHIRELGDEFDRTGNKGLLKDIGKDKSQLRQLEGLAKTLGSVGAIGGKEFNKGFLSTMGELGGNLRGALIPAAIGIGVVISPIIGAAIAGAVTGAVGLGGIAGGIAAAAQDARVKQAASHFAEDIGHVFTEAGNPFIEPVIASLDILEQGFRDLHLDEVFAKAAPAVTEFAHGLSGLFTEMMPGLNRALDQLGPAMDVMATELPEVGAALGDMIGDMAESEGSIEGLHYIFEMLEVTLRVTGTTVAWLGDRFHDMASAGASFTGAMEDITAKLGFVSPLVGLTSGKFAEMNDHLEEILGIAPQLDSAWAPIPGRLQSTSSAATDTTSSVSHLTMSINDLKNALDAAFDKQMSYDQAILAIQKDTIALRAAVASGTATLNTNTQAGVTNKGMILDLIKDYEAQRDASIKMGKSTAEATRKFDDQIGALGQMLEKLGFSKSAVDKLLSSYRKLHDAPDIQKEIRINVTTTGQTGALSLMGNVGKVAAFAEGGWVGGPEGQPQMAVVHGGEYVLSRDMLRGRTSAPPRATKAVPSGGGATRVEAVWAGPSGAVEDVIGELVRRYVYFRGGDPTTALAS